MGQAPLAKFENEDWVEFTDYQASLDLRNSNNEKTDVNDNDSKCVLKNADPTASTDDISAFAEVFSENYAESLSGSLEDLVSTFDEKITKCFCNYEEKSDKIAPVQVRTQEEIMNECQMWWTITG